MRLLARLRLFAAPAARGNPFIRLEQQSRPMHSARLVLFSLFAGVTNVAVHAQQQTTPAAAPSSSATPPRAQECQRADAKSHNHANTNKNP